jgi:hypothetical protein
LRARFGAGKVGSKPGEVEMRTLMIAAALALAATSATEAASLTCPAKHHGKALDGVTVFDGPPKDMASLRPEDGREVNRKMRQTWDVRYDPKAGRRAHIQCRYKGGGSQVLKAPKATRTCVQQLQRLDNKGNYRVLSFRCD